MSKKTNFTALWSYKIKCITEGVKKMIFGSKEPFLISDHPTTSSSEDCLDVESRIVSQIYSFLAHEITGQLSIAITGKWGIGKTSALNLLRNKLLKDKTIVINFEPLLDGKFMVIDLIELFYIKLYSLIDDTKIKKIVSKCFKSLALLCRFKGNLSASVNGAIFGAPGTTIDGSLQFDIDKNINDILELWDKEKPEDFSKQAENLNNALVKAKRKIYVFIDEIDRLPATHIVNFLLFCRVLESFDNVVCFIGIDYEQTIKKLIGETSFQLNSIELAQGYLDKLFQLKFHVHHNVHKKIEYTSNELKKLDVNSVLTQLLDTPLYNDAERSRLGDIIIYLDTPRQIKKWLISLKQHYTLLQYSNQFKMEFLAFIATTVKHPIFIDYLCSFTIQMMTEAKNSDLKNVIKEKYNLELENNLNNTQILLASMGLMGIDESKLKSLREKLNVLSIRDCQAEKYLECYFENTPLYLVTLFAEGIVDHKKISRYQSFFSEDSQALNETLNALANMNDEQENLAFDLADTLKKYHIRPKGKPDPEKLNALWDKKIKHVDFFNPYEPIILCVTQKLSLEEMINDCCIALSEFILHFLLRVFSIQNEKGQYNLSQFQSANQTLLSEYGMADLTYNGKKLIACTKDDITLILEEWLKKASNDFKSLDKKIYSQKRILSTFYRYVQWNTSIKNEDARCDLAQWVLNYLRTNKETHLKNIINEEIQRYQSQNWATEDPMITLFDNCTEIKNELGLKA